MATGRRKLPQYVQMALAFALAAGTVVLFPYVYPILLVVFLGTIFAIAVDAVARVLQKLRLPRAAAVIVSELVILIGFMGALTLLGAPILAQGSEFAEVVPRKLEAFREKLGDLRSRYPILAGAIPANGHDETGGGEAGPTPVAAAKAVASTASSLLQGIWMVVAVLFLGLFLALDAEGYKRGVARLLPGGRFEDRILLLERIGAAFRSWLLALGFQAATTAVLATIGLWIIGLPYALFFGCLSGLLETVPYLGPLVGIVPPLLVAGSQGPARAFAVVGLYAFLHVLEGYILVPWVMKRREQLPPPLVILSVLGFGSTLGVLGVALAVPLAMLVYICVKYALLPDSEDASPRSALPGSDGNGHAVPEPHAIGGTRQGLRGGI